MLYTSTAIPGWALVAARDRHAHRSDVSREAERRWHAGDGRAARVLQAGEPGIATLAISPDGLRIYASTEDHGPTIGRAVGRRAGVLANPERSLEFTYSPADRNERSDMKRRAFLAVALGLAASESSRRRRRRYRICAPRRARLVGTESGALSRSRHHRTRQSLPPLHRRQHADQAPAHRHVVGRGSGVERRRPLPGVERRAEQRADA